MREHRNKAQGLPDLLNYAAMVDDGILMQKDGALLSCFDYRGPDLNSAGANELERLSAVLNQAIMPLGDGDMLHVDFVRQSAQAYPAPDRSFFPDPTSRLIDEERRQQHEGEGLHFESAYRLTYTYLPPSDVQAKFTGLFIEGEGCTQAGWEKTLAVFRHRRDALEQSLSRVLHLRRLNSEELLTYLYQVTTNKRHALRLPVPPMYLDTLIGSKPLIGGLAPKIGDYHIGAVTVTGFPLQSEPGLLRALESLPLEFRLSNRFICLDARTAVRHLKIVRRNWLQKRHGLMGILKEVATQQAGSGLQNRDALAMVEDAESALEEAESGLVRYGLYTCTLIVMQEDPALLAGDVRLIIKTVENAGFSAELETVNALEAYLGSLPGHGYQNVRKPILHSLNFADLIPLTSVWAGEVEHPCPNYPPHSPPLFYGATSGNTPVRVNLHVRDLGHTFIFGSTGGGKTTLLNFLAVQHRRYPNAQVWWFDKGHGGHGLAKLVGGAHYDLLGEDSALAFQPLADIHLESELNWACHWVESLLSVQQMAVTPAVRQEVRRALMLLKDAEPHFRTLSQLQNTVQDATLKSALDLYVLGGTLGKLLDADHTDIQHNPLQVFEIGSLMELGRTAQMPVFLYLFHQFQRSLSLDKPTLVIIEEGHIFLEGEFGKQILAWLRELRKYNAAVVFVTQNIEDVAKSDFANTMTDNVATRFFLPNPNAATKDNRKLYQRFGLTPRQIELIANGTDKQDYYYSSNLGQRMIQLGLGQVALTLLTLNLSTADQRHRLNVFIQTHGDTWVAAWLTEAGLPEWGCYWRALQDQGAEVFNAA